MNRNGREEHPRTHVSDKPVDGARGGALDGVEYFIRLNDDGVRAAVLVNENRQECLEREHGLPLKLVGRRCQRGVNDVGRGQAGGVTGGQINRPPHIPEVGWCGLAACEWNAAVRLIQPGLAEQVPSETAKGLIARSSTRSEVHLQHLSRHPAVLVDQQDMYERAVRCLCHAQFYAQVPASCQVVPRVSLPERPTIALIDDDRVMSRQETPQAEASNGRIGSLLS